MGTLNSARVVIFKRLFYYRINKHTKYNPGICPRFNLCCEIARMQAASFYIRALFLYHSCHFFAQSKQHLPWVFHSKAKAFRQSKLLDIFLNHETFRYFILVFCNRVYIRLNVNRIRCRPGCPGSSRNRRRWCIAR